MACLQKGYNDIPYLHVIVLYTLFFNQNMSIISKNKISNEFKLLLQLVR